MSTVSTPTPASADSGPAPEVPVGDVDQAIEAQRLAAEATHLKQAMATQPVLDHARGMIMALTPCPAATAWEILIEVSQHTHTRLPKIATALTATTNENEPLPKNVEKALATALRHHRPTPNR
ncbi:ANTAR domain-containing protein [Streptomyces smyrnaeus]|uniref:ANTAR domain-containing protein n=1 Tax=Streptomyces smyrnaeus TaxID=1387713 RepID=UPI0036D1ADC5